MRQKPTVLSREIVASSRLFRVEAVQLRFSNGAERTYERLASKGTLICTSPKGNDMKTDEWIEMLAAGAAQVSALVFARTPAPTLD